MSTIAYRHPTITRLTSADPGPDREHDFIVPGDFNDVVTACVRDHASIQAWDYIASPDDGFFYVWQVPMKTEGGGQ